MSAILNTTRRFILTACLLLFVAPAAFAQEPAEDIRTMLESRDQEIKAVIGTLDTFTPEQRDELKILINGIIDFEAMGEVALGNYWADLTEAQRTEFVEVFSEIVRAQSLANLEIYRAVVTYDAITVDGEMAQVRTTTLYKDTPTPVVYAMTFHDDAWHVSDIILDDVSTAEGYARSFQTAIRKRGFDGLMTILRKRLDKINAQDS